MKKITSEKTLIKKLHINSIEQIPEKLNKFIALLPQIDKDLATKVINQLSEYREICTEILNSLDASCERALQSADRSLKRTVNSYTKILNGLNKRLLKENLSESDRKDITNDMLNIADKIADLHREHQNFILKILAVILFPITLMLSIITLLITGKKKS